jgi:hypothetical protein
MAKLIWKKHSSTYHISDDVVVGGVPARFSLDFWAGRWHLNAPNRCRVLVQGRTDATSVVEDLRAGKELAQRMADALELHGWPTYG